MLCFVRIDGSILKVSYYCFLTVYFLLVDAELADKFSIIISPLLEFTSFMLDKIEV